MKRHEPTAEQRAAAQVRRQHFRELCKQVADMSPEAKTALSCRLPVTNCEGHVMSAHNQYLIMLQREDALVVGGFWQWKKIGRSVRKGEHGMMIWIPTGTGKRTADSDQDETEDGEQRRTGFIMGTVFDIAQTEEVTK